MRRKLDEAGGWRGAVGAGWRGMRGCKAHPPTVFEACHIKFCIDKRNAAMLKALRAPTWRIASLHDSAERLRAAYGQRMDSLLAI